MADSSRDEIAKLEALYANNPEGRVFTHLAEALRRAGDLERARTILETGLLKHAAYASAHVVLGRVLMGLHQVEDAAEAFRRVLGLDPHNLVALRSLGDIARAAGRNAEALSYFEELRHQDPNNEEIGEIITELSASPSAFATETAPDQQAEEELGSRFDPAEAVQAVSALQPDESEVQDTGDTGAAQPQPAAESALEPEPAQPEAEHEPEPVSEPLPDLAAVAEPTWGETSSDIDLDWVPSEEPESEDGLPGDLGSYAATAASSQPPEVPTFGLPEEHEIDLGDGEFEPPVEAADYEEISFDPLPATEAEVESDEFFDDVDITPPPAVPDYDTLPDSVVAFAEPPLESPPEPGAAGVDGMTVGDLELETEPAIEAGTPSEPALAATPEPAGFEPALEAAAFDAPAFDEPAFDEPAFDEPAFDEPMFDGPVFDEPASETSVFSPPELEPSPLVEETVVAPDTSATGEEDDGPEFVTETIAELYRSQGLHDRAAEVYTTLLQQRPGDEGLEAKLREVEALGRGESPVADDVAETEPESAVAGWEESLSRNGEPGFGAAIDPIEANEAELPDPAEAWLAGAMGTADSAPTPYAWTEQPADVTDEAPPITQYFKSLLSWKPSAAARTAGPAALDEMPVESPAAFDEVVLDVPAPQAAPESYEPEAADAQTDEIVFDELPTDHDGATMLLTDEMTSDTVPPLTAATVLEPEPLPWEEPEAPAEPDARAVGAAEPDVPDPFEPGTATNSEDAFDEWFGEPEGAPGAVAAEAAPPAAADTGAAAADNEGEDDDDLEMFRSWLQSLKK